MPETINFCAAQRAAVKSKESEIAGLQGIRSSLQLELHTATPGQKADIVDEIERVNRMLTWAEENLSDLQDLLDRCEGRFPGGQEVNWAGTVVVSADANT
jgi:hypothetical protein